MEITLTIINSKGIATIASDQIVVNHPDDALDILGNCGYQGAVGIILQEQQITPEFFDLRTGIAGEILQKFSTYQMKLAIVGNFEKYSSKALKDFIYESNKAGRINFVADVEEAKARLCK
ncbi:MAG: DUF4180 domain-containing protein [Chitinophaga sp.]|uniref:DUF4180 domain-containing protein n=1 Tax=Chitinophaga sp. TaxID=1869181 RepID=UPI001B1F9A39|nr:DUF4180 domain-containing protein [Chitinophaga sp.]MBO9731672.1 DUF4180 domain-containing protein [Chitinophaga sp.]